jgi:21S rRNA (GM2251-2'-O)-methyltransferase
MLGVSRKATLECLTGYTCIRNALVAQKRSKMCLMFVEEFQDERQRSLLKLCAQLNTPTERIYSRLQLSKMANQKEAVQSNVLLKASPLPIARIDSLPAIDSFKLNLNSVSKPNVFVALYRIVDPQNLGAIVRCAYFFGATGIVFTEKCSSPVTAAVSKASAGAVEVASVHSVSSMSNFLIKSKQAGWAIVGTQVFNPGNAYCSQPAIPSEILKSTRNIVLVMGNEHDGLPPRISELCDWHVQIAGGDSLVDSLNVAVATGILLNAFCKF